MIFLGTTGSDGMAYVRKKRVGKYEYYQLVEGKRVDGKVRQRVIAHLGKHDSIEAARLEIGAGVVSKNADGEQEGRYWITYPYRLGYDGSFGRHMFPVFLSREAAQAYGGPGGVRGEPKQEYDILGFDGRGLADLLRGKRLGANLIAIWGADYSRYTRDQKPEILSRRAFMKRLESDTN
jgi:hypothetical protein